MRMLVLLGLFILLGCQPNGPKLTGGDFLVRYDAEESTLRGDAVLYSKDEKGKEKSTLVPQIMLNQFPMTLNTMRGERYQMMEKMAAPNEAEIEIQLKKKDKFTVKLTIDTLQIDSIQFSMQSGLSGLLKGAAIEKGETLILELTDPTGKLESIQAKIPGPIASGMINFAAPYFQGLQAGIWRTTLLRTKKFTIELNGATYDCQSEFFSKPIQVTVN